MLSLTTTSWLTQYTKVQLGQRGAIVATVLFMGDLMVGLGVLVVAGMSANTIGESRSIYLFYGDAGMGLYFLILLEVAWVVIATIIAGVAFAIHKP